MCTREHRIAARQQAANRRTAAEANLPPRAATGAGRFRVGDEVRLPNGNQYRVTAVDTATGTVRGVPTDWNGPEQTLRERDARERAVMDGAAIAREDPEAALAAIDAANVDRVTRERVHEAFEARQRAHREENARREAEAAAAAADPQAQTAAEKQRAQQQADAVLARVNGQEFTTSDGVTVHGGYVSFAQANYGDGHGGNPGGGLNCYANAEAMEARLVYGVDVLPFGPSASDRAQAGGGEDNYKASAERAKRDGTFIPFDNAKSGGENCTNAMRALMDAPDGTFMRIIGSGHTKGLFKRNGRVYMADGFYGKLMELGTPTPQTLDSFVAVTRSQFVSYNGWVVLPPSERRLRNLLRSRFVVGSIENSGVYYRDVPRHL